MPNKWIEHVKSFAAKNNLSYGCAISKPECKSSYQGAKLKEVNAKNPIPSPNKSRKMKSALASIKSATSRSSSSSPMVGLTPSAVYSTPPAPVTSSPNKKKERQEMGLEDFKSTKLGASQFNYIPIQPREAQSMPGIQAPAKNAKKTRAKAPKGIKRGEKGFKKFIIEGSP